MLIRFRSVFDDVCIYDPIKYVKDRLKLIESMTVGSTNYDATLHDIMSHLKEHMVTEETQDFPLLEQKLGMEQSINVAKSFERTKAFVPTRLVTWYIVLTMIGH